MTSSFTSPTDMSSPFDVATNALTRLTLDAAAAIASARTSDERVYAFGLSHLVRDVTEMLAHGLWSGPTHAGHEVLHLLATRTERAPASVPDWMRVSARSWPCARPDLP